MAPDVTITLKTIDQSSAVVKKVNQEFKSLAPGLESATGKIGKFASANAGLLTVMGGVAAGAIAVGKAIYSSAKAYEESAKMSAKLEAVLKSTGGAAGQSVEGLNKMADSLSKISGIDDELITSAQAVLLTFTKVKDEAFAPTMQAALDMSAVLGGDLQGAIVQAGKAMNDFSGYTVLKRSGVSFTEEQIKQIKHFKETNDLVGYQNLLLNELKTEFGGAAEAMNKAGLGSENLKIAFGNLQEAAGKSSATVIGSFNRSLTDSVDKMTDWINKNNELADYLRNTENAWKDYATSIGITSDQVVSMAQEEAIYRAVASETKIAVDDNVNSFVELAATTTDNEEAFKVIAEAGKQYMSVLNSISTETEGFTEKNQELNDKLAELEEKLSKERKGSEKYKDLQGEIEDTKTAITDLAAEHAKASKSIMFDLISQQAAAEGFKNISVEALATIGEEWGVLAEGSGDATTMMIGQAEAWSEVLSGVPGEIKSIAEMWKDLDKLASKGVVLNASVVYSATGGAYGGQNTMTQCFTGDTLVSMANGSCIAIRDIRIGDKVLSHDIFGGSNITTKVIEVFEHPASDGGRLLLINNYLKVTPEHLLWNGHTWQPAGEFAPGDVLVNLDGSHMRVTSVREIVKNEPVYNIHVDHDAHNYYAGGVLVHNAKQNDVTTQWQGGTVGSFAGGGKGGGWGIVGDRQGGGWVDGVSELVYGNFKVFPSKQAKGMLKSGMLGKVPGFAFGGNSEDFGGMTGGVAVKIPYVPTPTPKSKTRSSGGDSSSSSNAITSAMQAIEFQAADMQASTQSAVVQMAQVTQQMTQQILQSNAQTQDELQRIAGILLHENPNAVGSAVAYKVALKSA